MFTKVHTRLRGTALVAVISFGFAAAAEATTVNLTQFGPGSLASAQHARGDFLANYKVTNLQSETFEDKAAWNGTTGTRDPQNTKAGSFTSLGGSGAGFSAIDGGHSLEVRGDNTMPWGRYDLDGVVSGKWLDSNDTHGMRWDIADHGKFNALAFFLIDAADVGAKFSIKVGDTLYANLLGGSGRTSNGNIQLVTILLDKAVDTLSVQLMHDKLNDGFGVDGATLAHVAPIPVPPAAALLVTGLLAFGAVRRRRQGIAAA
jgi:hypothetical protein